MGKTHKERSEETTEKVLVAAQKHFAELGYAGVSTDALVQEVGLTRGALYHHFGSKQGLFEAVAERVHEEIAEKIERRSATTDDLWEQLTLGCFAWLDEITDETVQRILLLDAPAILGWDAWLELDRHGLGELRKGVNALSEAQLLNVPCEALLHLLNGAMNQAALWVAQSPNPQQALADVKETLSAILEGLRK